MKPSPSRWELIVYEENNHSKIALYEKDIPSKMTCKRKLLDYECRINKFVKDKDYEINIMRIRRNKHGNKNKKANRKR